MDLRIATSERAFCLVNPGRLKETPVNPIPLLSHDIPRPFRLMTLMETGITTVTPVPSRNRDNFILLVKLQRRYGRRLTNGRVPSVRASVGITTESRWVAARSG